jgi:hypothetical protein
MTKHDCALTLVLLQPFERQPMTAGMPLTKLVLALHMSEQLGRSKESHLAQQHVIDRCVLPMGFLEQVWLLPWHDSFFDGLPSNVCS